MTSPIDYWHSLLESESAGPMCARLTERCASAGCGSAIASSVRFSGRSSSTPPTSRASRASPRRCGPSGSASPRRRSTSPEHPPSAGAQRGRDPAGAHRSRLRHDEHRGARRRVHPAGFAAVRGIQRRIAGRRRLQPGAGRAVFGRADDGALPRAVRRAHVPAGRGAARRAGRELSRVGRHRVAAARWRSSTGARCRPSASSRSCAMRSSRSASRRSSAIRATSIFEPAGAGPRFSEAGLYVHGQRIDLVYRRVLINDIARARSRMPRAAGRLRGARRVRGELAALQDPAQEGVLRRAHRRAARARCSPPRSARSSADTSRGPRSSKTDRSCATARRSTSSRTCARTATSSSSSRTTSTAAPA